MGLIVGTQLVNRLVRSRSKPHVVVMGLFGLGVGVAVLGIFHNIPTAALSTFTMGFSVAFVLVPAQTMSQQETPPQMVGRVSSSFMSLISFAQVLGLLLSGLLAQRLGIRPLFLASAGTLAMISGIGYLMIRKPLAPARTATS
jgi:MFS transporter, DHA3 family, macrolide efflux protein